MPPLLMIKPFHLSILYISYGGVEKITMNMKAMNVNVVTRPPNQNTSPYAWSKNMNQMPRMSSGRAYN